MLRLLICSLLLAAGHLSAQSATITLPLDGATTLHLSAQFSGVTITTGSGPDVIVEHLLTIDGTPRPDLAKLEVSRQGGVLTVTETHPTLAELEPSTKRKVTVIQGVRTSDYSNRNLEVSMIVQVPKGLAVTVETVYGNVDVTDVAGLEQIHATYGPVTVVYSTSAPSSGLDLYSNYGSVDLTLPPTAAAQLELTTEFGELLTDFDIAIDEARSEQRQFFERVVGTIGAVRGGGAQVQCKAPYGKIYLRQDL